jgi:hypothetical protein
VFLLRENFDVSGAANTFERESDSGFPVRFHFCPTCASTVFWEPARLPDRIGVAIGAFADPTFPPPTQAVYGEHRAPWVSVALAQPPGRVG